MVLLSAGVRRGAGQWALHCAPLVPLTCLAAKSKAAGAKWEGRWELQGHWALYPKYIKNPYNSTLKRQTTQLKNNQRTISSDTHMAITHKKTLDTTGNREMKVTTSETDCTSRGRLHSDRRQRRVLARTWRNQNLQHTGGNVQQAVSL